MEIQQFEIRDGIPLPPAGESGGRPHKYPLARMKPGQSFDVPLAAGLTAEERERARTPVSNAAAHRKKHFGEKFTTRLVRDGDALVIRVWRVS